MTVMGLVPPVAWGTASTAVEDCRGALGEFTFPRVGWRGVKIGGAG